MKIIVFENNYELHNIEEHSPLYNSSDSPIVYTLPDTALLKDHRPFFIPDFASECSLRSHLVVRICRLGRSISARFAHRYYDAVSVGVTFTAENILKDLRDKHLPWELAKGFDGAAALGSFIPLRDVTDGLNTEFSLRSGGNEIQKGCAAEMLRKVDELIADVSQYYTLKQGDFIFTGCPVAPMLVQPDQHITGYVADRQVLSFNIK